MLLLLILNFYYLGFSQPNKRIFMIPPLTYGVQPIEFALFHGGPGTAGNMPVLGQRLTNLASSLQLQQDKTSIKSLISHIDDQISRFSKDKVILIGHSFGAWIAGIYASQFRNKVKKVILIGTGPLKYEYVNSIHKTRLRRLNDMDGEEYMSSLSVVYNYDIPRAKLALRRIKYFTDITDNFRPIKKHDFSPPVDLHVFRSLMTEMSYWRKSGKLLNAFAGINCPLTFIQGDYDPHPTKGIIDPLKEKGVSHTFHTLKNCGHEPWMEMEKADEFLKIMASEFKLA
jgi:pimeloyl-ACP methyl ester carboxylesterase